MATALWIVGGIAFGIVFFLVFGRASSSIADKRMREGRGAADRPSMEWHDPTLPPRHDWDD